MKNEFYTATKKSRARRQLIAGYILCLVFFLLFGYLPLMAQGLSTYDGSTKKSRGIELTGLYGWQWGGTLHSDVGEVKISPSDAWGFEIDIPIPKGIQAVLLYQRQESRLDQENDITGNHNSLFDMSVNYFQVGGIRGIHKGKIMPFGMFTLGATLFDPVGSEYESKWFFSINLGLGVKIYNSEKFGMRVQVNMLMPMKFSGGGVYFGTGGAGVGVTSDAIFQGFVGGGLFYMI
jgi:hypothetical protein